MSITIIKAGLFSTVQDTGRKGFQHLGINPNGAMDVLAMQIANLLIQNKADEAVIEFFYPAPVFRFNTAAFIALSGADFVASINDIPVPINHPIFVPENAVLSFTKKQSGHIGYLAIQGGLELNEWMNSYSTNTRAGAGGMEGRALQSKKQIELISSGVTNGTIQLLPSGQCIVLLADHQTTGGYPRIGHIIQSDIPTLVQQSPGTVIRLIPVNMETAEKINTRQGQYLQQLKNACTLQLN